MTPIEHRVLSAVKTLLEGSQKPSVANLAELVGLGEKQTYRYVQRLTQQEYLAPHHAWLRVPTGIGMQAIARGPDERIKGPGRPKRGLSRAAFVLLRSMAFESIEDQKRIRTNPRMRHVNINYLYSTLEQFKYIEVIEQFGVRKRDWCVTQAGMAYLDEMRMLGHDWWLAEESAGEEST
jgi:hypothetical protein